jgi:quercetin dioxygenase-like cupin family protein
VVEIGEGELIFRREELAVTLLVDIEELAAVDVLAAPGWGKSPLHIHERHAEALFVFEGELALRLEDRVHRVGPETWAFVPPGVVHSFETTSDTPARFLVLHAPGSGYGDYVRGLGAPFDQQPPPEYATGDPNLVVVRRAGGNSGVGSTEPPESAGAGFAGAGAEYGEKLADQPERRSTILVDADELTLAEFMRGPGVRGAEPHVHHHHADAFLVREGELTVTVGSEKLRASSGTLVVCPPNVIHGFDNDGSECALFYNLHLPASGFADYLRGRNPDFDQHDPPADGGADPSTAIVVRLSR